MSISSINLAYCIIYDNKKRNNISCFCVGCERIVFSVQRDDMDGEIDLKSCVKVSEFDVEKNYGFQIQVNISLAQVNLFHILWMWLIFFNIFLPFCLPLPHPLFVHFISLLFCYHDSIFRQHLLPISLCIFQFFFIISISSQFCHIFVSP